VDRAEPSCLAFSASLEATLSADGALDLRPPTQPWQMWCCSPPGKFRMEMVLYAHPVSAGSRKPALAVPGPVGLAAALPHGSAGPWEATCFSEAWRRAYFGAPVPRCSPRESCAAGPDPGHTGCLDSPGEHGISSEQPGGPEGRPNRPGLIPVFGGRSTGSTPCTGTRPARVLAIALACLACRRWPGLPALAVEPRRASVLWPWLLVMAARPSAWPLRWIHIYGASPHRACNCFWCWGCLGGLAPSSTGVGPARMLPTLAADSPLDLGPLDRSSAALAGVGLPRNFLLSSGRSVGVNAAAAGETCWAGYGLFEYQHRPSPCWRVQAGLALLLSALPGKFPDAAALPMVGDKSVFAYLENQNDQPRTR